MKLKIIILLLSWLMLISIQQACSPVEEPLCEVSYKNDLVPITSMACTGYCHTTTDHYSVYENIKAVVDNGLLKEKLIDSKEMPLYPSFITEEQREQFACWIEAGAPNN